ncbi:cytochrome c1 [Orrella marina]|uniref:Cytochrome c1 n=2 Tax=Orrella marina TaxID=2163011 RepID=A0A2R4XM90_9BURK|nr:cytochrome c1 [Orrella marina]
MIKKILGAIALSLTCATAMAAGESITLDKAPNRLNDQAALQNGAKLFINYCLNCHSATSMRYNRLRDIGLTDIQIRENLLFTGEKVGDLMTISMDRKDAAAWFGAPAPDLSVMARAKSINAGPPGGDYIYTYLRTYYRDTTKPTGWNNLAFPNAGMPHVLWDLQGPRELTTTTIHQVERDGKQVWEKVETKFGPQGYWDAKAEVLDNYRGSATESFAFKALDPRRAAAYDDKVADISNFMTWMAEPVQLKRKQIGVWVMIFLGLFLVIAWRLNASYWKHVK